MLRPAHKKASKPFDDAVFVNDTVAPLHDEHPTTTTTTATTTTTTTTTTTAAAAAAGVAATNHGFASYAVDDDNNIGSEHDENCVAVVKTLNTPVVGMHVLHRMLQGVTADATYRNGSYMRGFPRQTLAFDDIVQTLALKGAVIAEEIPAEQHYEGRKRTRRYWCVSSNADDPSAPIVPPVLLDPRQSGPHYFLEVAYAKEPVRLAVDAELDHPDIDNAATAARQGGQEALARAIEGLKSGAEVTRRIVGYVVEQLHERAFVGTGLGVARVSVVESDRKNSVRPGKANKTSQHLIFVITKSLRDGTQHEYVFDTIQDAMACAVLYNITDYLNADSMRLHPFYGETGELTLFAGAKCVIDRTAYKGNQLLRLLFCSKCEEPERALCNPHMYAVMSEAGAEGRFRLCNGAYLGERIDLPVATMEERVSTFKQLLMTQTGDNLIGGVIRNPADSRDTGGETQKKKRQRLRASGGGGRKLLSLPLLLEPATQPQEHEAERVLSLCGVNTVSSSARAAVAARSFNAWLALGRECVDRWCDAKESLRSSDADADAVVPFTGEEARLGRLVAYVAVSLLENTRTFENLARDVARDDARLLGAHLDTFDDRALLVFVRAFYHPYLASMERTSCVASFTSAHHAEAQARGAVYAYKLSSVATQMCFNFGTPLVCDMSYVLVRRSDVRVALLDEYELSVRRVIARLRREVAPNIGESGRTWSTLAAIVRGAYVRKLAWNGAPRSDEDEDAARPFDTVDDARPYLSPCMTALAGYNAQGHRKRVHLKHADRMRLILALKAMGLKFAGVVAFLEQTAQGNENARSLQEDARRLYGEQYENYDAVGCVRLVADGYCPLHRAGDAKKSLEQRRRGQQKQGNIMRKKRGSSATAHSSGQQTLSEPSDACNLVDLEDTCVAVAVSKCRECLTNMCAGKTASGWSTTRYRQVVEEARVAAGQRDDAACSVNTAALL